MYGGGDYSDCYVYLANGTKILHEYKDRQQDECRDGSLVYEANDECCASFGGGRIVGTDNGTEVHYFLTDHLGSTRVVAKVTTAGRDDLDRKDYYPFGKEWAQSDMPTSDNRYQFSGKERSNICLENDYSSILPVYDFGARSYYPEGVFFFQQDPLMEKYYSIGQYNYCAGNPVNNIDLLGLDIYRYDDSTGALTLEQKTDDEYDQIGKFKYDKETGTYTLKTNKKGEARTRIDKIEKGILSDGMNLMTDNNVIEVGGEGQATVEGFESFAIEFSEMIGKEVGGYYLSAKNQEEVKYIYIGRTIDNTPTAAKAGFNIHNSNRPDLVGNVGMHTSYHTHLSMFDTYSRTHSSGPDRKVRNDNIRTDTRQNGVKKFIILTRGYSPIDYTND